MRSEIPLVILDAGGNAVPTASVAIYTRNTTNLAPIYQAPTGILTFGNPLSPDASGNVTGWLDRGAYQAVVSGGGLTTYTEYFDINPARGTPVITGSRGGNTALASLLTSLATEGIIVDQTSN